MAFTAPAKNILGEIVRATTSELVAQCPDANLNEPPAFGAFVRTPQNSWEAPSSPSSTSEESDPFAESAHSSNSALSNAVDGIIYAIVSYAETASSETGRNPAPFGLFAEALAEEHPQLPELLATEFSALYLGFSQRGAFKSYLPPKPARLHGFVSLCSPDEIRAITANTDYLRALLQFTATTGSDELIAAAVREGYAARGSDFEFLVESGKRLAILLRDQPDRLASLLRKLDPSE